jgi:hypothetical protein
VGRSILEMQIKEPAVKCSCLKSICWPRKKQKITQVTSILTGFPEEFLHPAEAKVKRKPVKAVKDLKPELISEVKMPMTYQSP